MHSVTIIGPGRMGGALAIALGRCGYRIDSLVGRDPERAAKIARLLQPRPIVRLLDPARQIKSGIILITTPDRYIADTTRRLDQAIVDQRQIVYHTSGSLSSRILRPLADRGISVGSIHPLISVSSPVSGADQFSGAYFCIEGDSTAVKAGMRISRQLGGKPFSIRSESKPIYHLAAVMAAGHMVALADVAFSLMAETGLGPKEARRVLLPLIASTVANLQKQEPEDALTGPFVRGDRAVVEQHLNALNKVGRKGDSDIYLDLALRSLDIAERRGDGIEFGELRKLILLAKQNTK